MPRLEIDSLQRVVDGDAIVDGISLRVDSGEIVAIVGPSGAGKSSFLRLLNRLDEPTAGTVYVDGTDYRDRDPQSLRREIGFVAQQPALRAGSVAENIALGALVCDEPIDHDRVASLLTRMGLEGYADRTVDDLSGGEAQRVALARALYLDPAVLLLDEPTAHLDDAAEAQVESLMADLLCDRGLTCLIVTHDTSQAQRLGDRIVEIEAGTTVTDREPVHNQP